MKSLDDRLNEWNSEIQEASFERKDRYTLSKLHFLLYSYSWLANFPSPIPFLFKYIPVIFNSAHLERLDVSRWYFRFAKALFYANASFNLPLTLYAQIAGTYTKFRPEVDYHNLRCFRWQLLAIPTYYIYLFLGTINLLSVFILPFVVISIPSIFEDLITTFIALLVLLLVPISAILMPVLIMRFLGGFWNRYYIDSICVREIIYILCELIDDDVILNMEKKYSLQYRMQLLARCTRQLSRRIYDVNHENLEWTEKHFGQMSRYILDRARWLSAPTESTLVNLRKDFSELATIFITEQYGAFRWQYEDVSQNPSATFLERLNLAFVNFVRGLGFSIPLVAFWLYLRDPSKLPIPLKPEIAGLILFAWLLLGIDAVFKLGLVRDLVDLAKGIKDLS